MFKTYTLASYENTINQRAHIIYVYIYIQTSKSINFFEVHYIRIDSFFLAGPGQLNETRNIEDFSAMIAGLHANGGGGTPEPSIGATIRAIEASEPGSPIYVFTDAPASDEHRCNEAISLLIRKNTPIYFSLVNLRLHRRSLREFTSRKRRHVVSNISNIYERLASFSGGQVLHVQINVISRLGSHVSFSALQNRHTIFYASDTLYGMTTHSIAIDSSILEATISVSGQHITVSVFTSQGQFIECMCWNVCCNLSLI